MVDDGPDGALKAAIVLGEAARLSPEELRAKYRDDPNWPIQSFDARDWAEKFSKLTGMDEAWALTWFANALMRGFDEGMMRARASHGG